MNKSDYVTPPYHIGFKAKKIYGEPIKGEFLDCAIAYIEPNGGGPRPSHTHQHSHFFIVTKGVTTIHIGQELFRIKEDEAIYVDGKIKHSIWNETDKELKMIGITINTKN